MNKIQYANRVLKLLFVIFASALIVQAFIQSNILLLISVTFFLITCLLIIKDLMLKATVNTAVSEDLNDRIRQLEKKLQEAEIASLAKNQFLANVSHEIRTPLSAILGFVELIDDPGLSIEDRFEFSRIIRNNGEYLAKIVNDILDISQIENSKLTIRKSATKVKKVLGLVLAMMEIKAAEKGLKLTIEYLSDLPEVVFVDEVRFRQVIVNLVGNAIKFTKSGSVSLSVACYATGLKEIVTMEIIVRDTGEGIPETQKCQLFKMFSQVNLNNGSRPLGTGIGLALSRKLARLMNGDIALLESRPGAGSAFIFTLPAKIIIDGKVETSTKTFLSGRPLLHSGSSGYN